jgi:hypothetical protein
MANAETLFPGVAKGYQGMEGLVNWLQAERRLTKMSFPQKIGKVSLMYVFLNKFFFVFHSALIVLILFGWAWRKTRLANLAVILLTAISWFVLGIWYGYGYCPCTDWHWQVRAKLGIRDMPTSYTKFLIDSFTGWDINQKTVDILTLILLAGALTASLYVNIRAWRKKRGIKPSV